MGAELKHLRVIVAAADCGSFSSAALQLNIDISAVSRAVREIEDTLFRAAPESAAPMIRETMEGGEVRRLLDIPSRPDGTPLTREEFEAVRAMAQKAREENDALLARIATLEGLLKAAPNGTERAQATPTTPGL